MKRQIALLAIAAVSLLALAGSAAASPYFLPFGLAKTASHNYAENVCGNVRGCYRATIFQCLRRATSRVDCGARLDFTDGSLCTLVVENRANAQGQIVQRQKQEKCG